MSWTLRDANGVEKSAADWGVGELARVRVNQQADTLTFRAAGRGSDADPLFALGSTVRLFNDGAPWFYGRVIQVPGRATGAGEDQLYKLAGPWWYLENLVFQQAWEMTNGLTTSLVATNVSRIILGQASDGTKLATGAAIVEVLNYAIAQGSPLAIGTITPNAIAPYAEVLDESCAAIIRHFLRWTPDAIAAFDYTTSPYPTLSIVQRSSAAGVTLPAYGAPVSGLELTPRYDLQTPCVQLKFEQTDDLGGDTFTALSVQTAPTSATGNELGALVMTVDLAGARATYHSQAITTAAIPSSGATTSAVLWWQGKFPWLNDFAASDLTVVSGTQTSTIENPASYPDVTAADLPNELLSGSISSWMNFQSAPLIVQATLQFTGTATDESNDVFGPTNQRVVYTRVVGTNADIVSGWIGFKAAAHRRTKPMRTLLAGTFFFLAAACWPACASDGPRLISSNDTKSALIMNRLNSIIIDRFGVEEGPASARSIRQQLAYLTRESKQMDPAHLGVTLRLRESPTDPPPPAPPPAASSAPGSPPAYRPVQDWEYVPLRVLLNYICRANGLSYDIENGEVVLFHPAQKAIVL